MTKLEKLKVLEGEGPFEYKDKCTLFLWESVERHIEILSILKDDECSLREVKKEPEVEYGQTVRIQGEACRYNIDSFANQVDLEASQWVEFKPWHGGECPDECIGRTVVIVDREGCAECFEDADRCGSQWKHKSNGNCVDDIVWYGILYKFMTKGEE